MAGQIVGKKSLGVTILFAAAFLAGCGGEAVVEGTPSLPVATPTTSVVVEPESDSEGDDSTGDADADSNGAETDDGSADGAVIGEPAERYLGELRRAGVQPVGDGTYALSTADYVCAAQADGVPRDVMLINVMAMVGLEQQRAGNSEPGNDVADTYIDVAERHYCDR
ncbi:hypothetical protein IEU95_11145 [Hoyosella rhizosphaerae]|uniref:DUF732 domain-containing protein n=1 Tax=Hoyosella rhizosphaerae TaxID=1755582 RepID=A0A916UA92_9ACTN|nr:DUF732 domain-containing protein [Hoyosella rhizosphaerae]MBN4927389.1 hypothetical protein [Hoyosella rhizosphaerae]GGC64789.1 hypothetical protein GCM10011410_16700 [Hoyosella rhizosphaerae]